MLAIPRISLTLADGSSFSSLLNSYRDNVLCTEYVCTRNYKLATCINGQNHCVLCCIAWEFCFSTYCPNYILNVSDVLTSERIVVCFDDIFCSISYYYFACNQYWSSANSNQPFLSQHLWSYDRINYVGVDAIASQTSLNGVVPSECRRNQCRDDMFLTSDWINELCTIAYIINNDCSCLVAWFWFFLAILYDAFYIYIYIIKVWSNCTCELRI